MRYLKMLLGLLASVVAAAVIGGLLQHVGAVDEAFAFVTAIPLVVLFWIVRVLWPYAASEWGLGAGWSTLTRLKLVASALWLILGPFWLFEIADEKAWFWDCVALVVAAWLMVCGVIIFVIRVGAWILRGNDRAEDEML